MEALKPCPFCGSSNVEVDHVNAICEDCCMGIQDYHSTKQELLDQWNKRAPCVPLDSITALEEYLIQQTEGMEVTEDQKHAFDLLAELKVLIK